MDLRLAIVFLKAINSIVGSCLRRATHICNCHRVDVVSVANYFVIKEQSCSFHFLVDR